MIVAIGIDLVEIARIEEVFARRGDRFRERVFTEGEISYCERARFEVCQLRGEIRGEGSSDESTGHRLG